MTTEQDVGKGAGIAVGVAAAACSVIPGIGTGLCAAGAAIASAFVALGTWISSAFRDTFHPDRATAEAWLMMMRVHPALTMLNVDVAKDPDDGSRLVRYFMIVGGETPQGKKGNNGQLHNPTNSHSCDNPYQCNDDGDEPLTSMAVLENVKARYDHWVATGGGKNLQALSSMVPTLHRRPDEARLILAAIRQYPQPFKNIAGWSEIQANLNQVQEQLRALRLIAGEDGPDPGRVLESIFGGDLTVHQRGHDPSIHKPFASFYPFKFLGGKWVPMSAAEVKKVENDFYEHLSPADRLIVGLAGKKENFEGRTGRVDEQGVFVVDNVSTLSPEDRVKAGYVGKKFTIDGIPGHIDAQGAFIVNSPKTASGPGLYEDKSAGYLILGGAVALTLGAFVALVHQRPD
jgi:hypothetical protein